MRISQTGRKKYAIVITVPVIVSLFVLFSELNFSIMFSKMKEIIITMAAKKIFKNIIACSIYMS